MQPASATRSDVHPSVGSEELAEGLMLVRASTLKIIRLQLAMERRDPRVALEAIDDLVALDRSLKGYLLQVSSSQEDGLFNDVLERERSALNVEKHTLAAGISTRNWDETPEPVAEDEAVAEWAAYGEEEIERPNWGRRIAIAVTMVAVAGLAYFLGASGVVPGLIGSAS